MQIHTAIRRTTYQGLPAYYPALVFQDAGANGRTVKQVRVYSEFMHPTKSTALKYAAIYRNEELRKQARA